MRGRPALYALVVGLAWPACSGPAAKSQPCDPQGFRAVQIARASRSEVTVCGTVVTVGRIRRSRSGTHRTFFVDAGAGHRVEVDANLDIMGDLPVRRGERAIVHGEYYADAGGRDGVHWTHRTLHGTHPPGYVVLDGTTYE